MSSSHPVLPRWNFFFHSWKWSQMSPPPKSFLHRSGLSLIPSWNELVLKLGWHPLKRFDTHLLPVNGQKVLLAYVCKPCNTWSLCLVYTEHAVDTQSWILWRSQWISVGKNFLDWKSLHKGLRAEKSLPWKANTCGALMFLIWHVASHCSSCFLRRLSGSSRLALLPLIGQVQIRYARSLR